MPSIVPARDAPVLVLPDPWLSRPLPAPPGTGDGGAMTTTPTTTLITGATKGLGLAAATQLAAAGHTVYVTARDPDRARAVATAIGGHPLQLDVTSDDSVTAAARALRQQTGRLDVLINNAGIMRNETVLDQKQHVAHAEATIATNLLGPIRLTAALLPLLQGSRLLP